MLVKGYQKRSLEDDQRGGSWMKCEEDPERRVRLRQMIHCSDPQRKKLKRKRRKNVEEWCSTDQLCGPSAEGSLVYCWDQIWVGQKSSCVIVIITDPSLSREREQWPQVDLWFTGQLPGVNVKV